MNTPTGVDEIQMAWKRLHNDPNYIVKRRLDLEAGIHLLALHTVHSANQLEADSYAFVGRMGELFSDTITYPHATVTCHSQPALRGVGKKATPDHALVIVFQDSGQRTAGSCIEVKSALIKTNLAGNLSLEVQAAASVAIRKHLPQLTLQALAALTDFKCDRIHVWLVVGLYFSILTYTRSHFPDHSFPPLLVQSSDDEVRRDKKWKRQDSNLHLIGKRLLQPNVECHLEPILDTSYLPSLEFKRALKQYSLPPMSLLPFTTQPSLFDLPSDYVAEPYNSERIKEAQLLINIEEARDKFDMEFTSYLKNPGSSPEKESKIVEDDPSYPSPVPKKLRATLPDHPGRPRKNFDKKPGGSSSNLYVSVGTNASEFHDERDLELPTLSAHPAS